MHNEPIVLVTVIPAGGKEVRLDLSDQILSFEYEDCEDKADQLKLTVDNHDLRNFDDPIWAQGNIIEASWGYPEALAPTRRCRIEKVTGFQELSIEALGEELAMNQVVRNRIFENMSRSDVIKQIAREHGYNSPEVLHIENTKTVRGQITQARLTDMQFISRLAHQEGMEWYVDFDGFHFHKRNLAQRPLRVIEYTDSDHGVPKEVLSISIENDVVSKPGTVHVKSRDPQERRTIDTVASHETEQKRTALASVQALPGTDSNFLPPAFLKMAQSFIMPSSERTEDGAQRTAAAEFRRSQHTAVKMTIEMLGDPNLLAKSVVEVRGVGKRLSQRYYVTEVKHTIDSGYKCSVKLVSDGTGGHETTSELAKEASAIQVGPGINGRKGMPSGEGGKRTIDTTPDLLAKYLGKDPDGAPQVTFQPLQLRDPVAPDEDQ